MKYIADLHIHSRFSRATAKNLDIENLHIAAQKKGIGVIATGDFTHPGWFAEIKEKLTPAEPGLFQLKKELAAECNRQVPPACRAEVRFVLAAEISNIYKKNEKTRKNHNLIFMPDMETAEQMSAKLDNIGNIHSDGRPILGLDARDLLEILIETTEDGFLIPAHIWTPWFSVLGSKSGFDSIEECFGDLTPYIFAVETGLSSDPAMNWRVSNLDRFTLVSNSDAHSPGKLGREANLFDTELSFYGIRSALKRRDSQQFLGTFEFYPEEGKYHADGHRKCGVRMLPPETAKNGGICPVCQKPLTVGVLYRVEELADRPVGYRAADAPPYYNLIPLQEVLGDIFGVGPNTKRVMRAYEGLLERVGSEFSILHFMEAADLDGVGVPLLGEAIRRMRGKRVLLTPGYDGEFGKIKLFEPLEKAQLLNQKTLFGPQPNRHTAPSGSRHSEEGGLPKNIKPLKSEKKKTYFPSAAVPPDKQNGMLGHPAPDSVCHGLNPEQLSAVRHTGGPLLIMAGPGTGKTRTLTHRIAYLIKKGGIRAEKILALTFTNKAALEMKSRLSHLLGPSPSFPTVATFHGLCLSLLKEDASQGCNIVGEDRRRAVLADAVDQVTASGGSVTMPQDEILKRIVRAKQRILDPESLSDPSSTHNEQGQVSRVYKQYQRLMAIEKTCDYEELIFRVVRLLENDEAFSGSCRKRFTHLFVDEYQDLNHGQYRIIRSLAGEKDNDLFVIGDPDQSIYGFRGSDFVYFEKFMQDFPGARTIQLTRNYRSTTTILDASTQVIRQTHKETSGGTRLYTTNRGRQTIGLMGHANERAEAVAVGKLIEKKVGGLDFHVLDSGQVEAGGARQEKSFADFAVLYRTHGQGNVIAGVFERAGIPYQMARSVNRRGLPAIDGLMSLARVISGTGTYADFEKIRTLTVPGIGTQTSAAFKRWGYRHGLPLKKALYQATRLPIGGMSATRQKRLFGMITYMATLDTETQKHSLADRLQYLATETKLAGMFENVADAQSRESLKNLRSLAQEAGDDAHRFFNAVTLQSDTDTCDPRAEKVTLTTMHAAKGLEFPVVIIAGCEKGLIPFSGGKAQADLKEERRLFYVAMTRAEESLYFTWAGKRTLFGRRCDREMSPFVADIEKELLKRESDGRKIKQPRQQVQLSLF